MKFKLWLNEMIDIIPLIQISSVLGRSLRFDKPRARRRDRISKDQYAYNNFKDILTDLGENPIILDKVIDEIHSIYDIDSQISTNEMIKDLREMIDLIGQHLNVIIEIIRDIQNKQIIPGFKNLVNEYILLLIRDQYDTETIADAVNPTYNSPLINTLDNLTETTPPNWQEIHRVSNQLRVEIYNHFIHDMGLPSMDEIHLTETMVTLWNIELLSSLMVKFNGEK